MIVFFFYSFTFASKLHFGNWVTQIRRTRKKKKNSSLISADKRIKPAMKRGRRNSLAAPIGHAVRCAARTDREAPWAPFGRSASISARPKYHIARKGPTRIPAVYYSLAQSDTEKGTEMELVIHS